MTAGIAGRPWTFVEEDIESRNESSGLCKLLQLLAHAGLEPTNNKGSSNVKLFMSLEAYGS